MNSKERVLCALDHKEADRVPIGEFGIDHDTAEKVIGRDTYWRNKKKTTLALWAGRRDEVVESYKKDLVELIEDLDQDLVPVHLVPPKSFQPTKVEQIGKNTWKDEQAQIWKYAEGSDAILPRLDLVRYVIDKLGDRKFIFARGFEEGVGNIEPLYLSEFEVPSVFFGGNMENFFLAIAMKPELVQEAFNLYTQINIAIAKVMIDEGVDAVMPGGDFSDSNGPMVSPETIRRIFLLGMKKLSEYCHQRGARVISHNCGNNWKIMDILIESGYECWQSIACKTADMDLKRLKEKYGDKIAFWGGINIETLYDGTPEENREDVLYALKHAAPGGGFILGTSNSVCFGTPYDNYMAALETVHKYGNYPIRL
jgi:hypothetical protein